MLRIKAGHKISPPQLNQNSMYSLGIPAARESISLEYVMPIKIKANSTIPAGIPKYMYKHFALILRSFVVQ